jgi:hypothetical protein
MLLKVAMKTQEWLSSALLSYKIFLSGVNTLNILRSLLKVPDIFEFFSAVPLVLLSVHRISSAPTVGIFVSFDIERFHLNLSRKSKFTYNRTSISGTLHE